MTRPLRRAEMNRSPCLDVSVSRGQGSHVAGLREILHQYARDPARDPPDASHSSSVRGFLFGTCAAYRSSCFDALFKGRQT